MEGLLMCVSMTGSPALQVTSLFLSIDGEVNARGQGTPSFFIRLAGCNLRCWQRFGGCDTVYSFGAGTRMSVDELLGRVEASGCPKVTLTGGEPLLQKGAALAALLRGLRERGVFVSVETNGSIAPDFEGRECVGSLVYDYKCPSTGCTTAMQPFDALFRSLGPSDYIKFVLRDLEDYAFARARVLEARGLRDERPCPVLAFSPMLPTAADGLPPDALVARLLADRLFEVQVNVQLHKYVWPDSKTEV